MDITGCKNLSNVYIGIEYQPLLLLIVYSILKSLWYSNLLMHSNVDFNTKDLNIHKDNCLLLIVLVHLFLKLIPKIFFNHTKHFIG